MSARTFAESMAQRARLSAGTENATTPATATVRDAEAPLSGHRAPGSTTGRARDILLYLHSSFIRSQSDSASKTIATRIGLLPTRSAEALRMAKSATDGNLSTDSWRLRHRTVGTQSEASS